MAGLERALLVTSKEKVLLGRFFVLFFVYFVVIFVILILLLL